jgi:hypothetical protein
MELTLLDPSCKAKMNGTHFILESPLNGCGTQQQQSAPDGVVYYNSVSVLQNKAFAGSSWVLLKISLNISVKMRRGLNKARCQFSTKWDALWPQTLVLFALLVSLWQLEDPVLSAGVVILSKIQKRLFKL